MAGATCKQAPQTLPSFGNGPRSIEQVKQTSTEGQRIKKVGAKNVGLADLAQQGAWFSAGDTQSPAQRIKLEGLGAKALADWRRCFHHLDHRQWNRFQPMSPQHHRHQGPGVKRHRRHHRCHKSRN